jgi:signal peptidase I
MKLMDGSAAKAQRYHGLRKAILAGSLVAVALWWIRRRPFRIAVEGPSMAPTLRPGDFLIAFAGSPVAVGSLVVVEHPRRPGYEMVKRVLGEPGGRIGHQLLGEELYWVTGDNRGESTDSRSFGPVGSRAIKGVVRLRYWPVSRVTWFR